MNLHRIAQTVVAGCIVATLSACGGISSGDSGLFGRRAKAQPTAEAPLTRTTLQRRAERERLSIDRQNGRKSTLVDLFTNSEPPSTTIRVNKYLWNASLDILNFLPIESVDPFTGVIVTGYGTPPGGGQSYRATIFVQDPALDARSLKVALIGRSGGAVAPETARAVEDAILTRARQLRIAESKL